MNKTIIRVENLSKNYLVSKRDKGMSGSIKGLFRRNHVLIEALKGISFSVNEGDCIGFIGPNGAGKSTTLKILSGILTPTSGSCTVLNRIPWKQRIEHVRRIGVVFGQRTQLWWDLPLQESFDLLKMVYSIPTHDFQKSLKYLLEILHMEPWLNVPVRQLSLGLRMRADLIASLLHDPDLLFLDEPSIGLDTETKCELRSFLKQLNTKKGKTILLASHDLWDVEALCTRLLFINHGCILRDTTLKAFLSEDILERSIKLKGISKEILIQFFPNHLIEGQGENLCLTIDTKQISLKSILASLSLMEGIEELIIEQPGIEDIVLKLYKETNKHD
jgi:ABC-2 type transport system ATP-binding protein